MKKLETYLKLSNIIVSTHALNLHRTEHPTDIVDDFDISGLGLLNIALLNCPWYQGCALCTFLS